VASHTADALEGAAGPSTEAAAVEAGEPNAMEEGSLIVRAAQKKAQRDQQK
jgi:hypothetical protein